MYDLLHSISDFCLFEHFLPLCGLTFIRHWVLPVWLGDVHILGKRSSGATCIRTLFSKCWEPEASSSPFESWKEYNTVSIDSLFASSLLLFGSFLFWLFSVLPFLFSFGASSILSIELTAVWPSLFLLRCYLQWELASALTLIETLGTLLWCALELLSTLCLGFRVVVEFHHDLIEIIHWPGQKCD